MAKAKAKVKKQSPFVAWYSVPENRESLNKRRRLKYRKNDEYRHNQLENTRRWRSEHRGRVVKVAAPRTHLTIGELADAVGCNQKTIRNLEAIGALPVSAEEGRHRRYKKHHIKLVSMLVTFRKDVHYKTEGRRAKHKELVARIKKEW